MVNTFMTIDTVLTTVFDITSGDIEEYKHTRSCVTLYYDQITVIS